MNNAIEKARAGQKTETVEAQSTAELLGDGTVRELILLAGKDGVGKSSFLISLAKYIEDTAPDATFHIIDTENKIKSTLRSFGADAPNNISYHKCDTMNNVTATVAQVLERHKPGDWLGVESLARIWDKAQDLAYLTLAQVTKAEYLSRRPKSGPGSGPIPQPDNFWQIVKGAHDGAFFDLLAGCDDLNSIFTTTIAKAKPDRDNRKENQDRKAMRIEFGIDCNLDGAPRLPYFIETLILQELRGNDVGCRVLRDNLSTADDPRPEFDVPDKKSGGPMFMATCRS